jgi:hypothetical protein
MQEFGDFKANWLADCRILLRTVFCGEERMNAMKQGEVKCHRCSAAMELGFVPDSADAGYLVEAAWVEGRPEPAKFLGMKTGSLNIKERQTYPITAYRCPDCGCLELFALPQDDAQDELLRPALSQFTATPPIQMLRMSEEPKDDK